MVAPDTQPTELIGKCVHVITTAVDRDHLAILRSSLGNIT